MDFFPSRDSDTDVSANSDYDGYLERALLTSAVTWTASSYRSLVNRDSIHPVLRRSGLVYETTVIAGNWHISQATPM